LEHRIAPGILINLLSHKNQISGGEKMNKNKNEFLILCSVSALIIATHPYYDYILKVKKLQ